MSEPGRYLARVHDWLKTGISWGDHPLFRTSMKIVILIALLVFGVFWLPSQNEASAKEVNRSTVNKQIREYRKNNDLPRLKTSRALQRAAQSRAEDMVRRNYFSHTNPDGQPTWPLIRAEGIDYVHAGENLAEGYYVPKDLMRDWVNSPSHKANLDNTAFTHIGIGIAKGDFFGDKNNTLVVLLLVKPQ